MTRSDWRILLTGAGLSLAAPVAAAGAVAVLGAPLARGAIVTADMLAEAPQGARGLPPALAVGREAVRDLPAGHQLRASDLRAVRLVRRGERVRIEVRRGGVLLATEGRALADAALDEPVAVMRDGAARALTGRARAPGLVEVG